MRKTIIAVIAGIAVVAGGFFAGTLIDTETAVAQEDATTTVAPDQDARPEDGRFGERRGPERRGPFGEMIEAAVEYLGMTPEELREALADGGVLADLTDDVDGLVAALVESAQAGLDEAVADGKIDAERAAEISENLEDRVTEFVTTAHERPERQHAGHHMRAGVKEAAEVIGIDASELADGLREGLTVVEIAEANGVSEDTLVDALVDSARERITEWVNKSFEGPAEG